MARPGREHLFTITLFPDEFATSKSEKTVTLSSLEKAIKRTRAGRKEDLPFLKLGTFGSDPAVSPSGRCYRCDANVLSITGVEADYDGGVMSPEEARDLLAKAGVEGLIYTSASHTKRSLAGGFWHPRADGCCRASATGSCRASMAF
jgi:hypothetical protein